jgi:hypothetical protein
MHLTAWYDNCVFTNPHFVDDNMVNDGEGGPQVPRLYCHLQKLQGAPPPPNLDMQVYKQNLNNDSIRHEDYIRIRL